MRFGKGTAGEAGSSLSKYPEEPEKSFFVFFFLFPFLLSFATREAEDALVLALAAMWSGVRSSGASAHPEHPPVISPTDLPPEQERGDDAAAAGAPVERPGVPVELLHALLRALGGGTRPPAVSVPTAPRLWEATRRQAWGEPGASLGL